MSLKVGIPCSNVFLFVFLIFLFHFTTFCVGILTWFILLRILNKSQNRRIQKKNSLHSLLIVFIGLISGSRIVLQFLVGVHFVCGENLCDFISPKFGVSMRENWWNIFYASKFCDLRVAEKFVSNAKFRCLACEPRAVGCMLDE